MKYKQFAWKVKKWKTHRSLSNQMDVVVVSIFHRELKIINSFSTDIDSKVW